MSENEFPRSLPAIPALIGAEEFRRQTSRFPRFPGLDRFLPKLDRIFRGDLLRSVDAALGQYEATRRQYESIRESHEKLCKQWRQNGESADLVKEIGQFADRATSTFKAVNSSMNDVRRDLDRWNPEKRFALQSDQISSGTRKESLTGRNHTRAVTALYATLDAQEKAFSQMRAPISPTAFHKQAQPNGGGTYYTWVGKETRERPQQRDGHSPPSRVASSESLNSRRRGRSG
jgi:hypothetical protein